MVEINQTRGPIDLMLEQERVVSDTFIQDGYFIDDVEDYSALKELRHLLVERCAALCGEEVSDENQFLNQTHKFINQSMLNNIRLSLIGNILNDSRAQRLYFSLAQRALMILVGNELVMQRQINLSIQLPGDNSSLLPIHADVWSGDSPFEVVLWVPLVDCYETKSMFLLPPGPTKRLHAEFTNLAGKTSEDLFASVREEVQWLTVPFGKFLIFNQNLPHGNRINQEKETRWSMNCRFKSMFSPYGDKKFGEFFVPIVVRAATELGMEYNFPGVE